MGIQCWTKEVLILVEEVTQMKGQTINKYQQSEFLLS